MFLVVFVGDVGLAPAAGSKSGLRRVLVVILIYTLYYYVYNDRYVRITLLEYYYIFIIVATVAVIFILDVLYFCDSTRYYKTEKN